MSAQPTPPPAPEQVNIEIDGKAMAVPKGSMIIQAADRAGIAIPRFCYHDKLPIAANCRMCLVDVEKAPKPMPACATPVMEGMKVYTQSKRALDSQRNVMEFLLINHPLDCPICDQGGECELQDLALGYGRSVSRFTERKRVVPDEDLGPLVATDMTRCIQCTRCVRFVSEIAGTHELGGLGRGENLEIGTYIGKSLESELSGNIIDVCPVGALTNKVFRFRARPWELIARSSVGYHDALNSSLHLHTRRGEVLRTVPRENSAVNECWLSDRDRYSHQGLYADDRAQQPMVRGADGLLHEVSWEAALTFVAEGLKRHQGGHAGALVSPMTSCEEGFLLARMLRELGSGNIDHRLRVSDPDDATAGATFEMPLAEVDKAGAILIVGGNPRLDQPLLGHRIRQAWKRGARVYAINPLDFDYHFELAGKRIVTPAAMADALADVALAGTELDSAQPGDAQAVTPAEGAPAEAARAMARALRESAASVVVFGDFAAQHPESAKLRALARKLARATGSAFNEIAQGANAVGLARVGARPGPAGASVAAMLAQPPQALILYNAYSVDFPEPVAFDRARKAASFVVSFASYVKPALEKVAHVVLPIGLPPEVEATFVNVDGLAQTLQGGARLPGQARPGWRVLRALGAAMGLAGFDFTELGELRAQLEPSLATPVPEGAAATRRAPRPAQGKGLSRIATVPIYRVDAVVRRAAALQASALAHPPALRLHPEDLLALGLAAGGRARVSDGSADVVLPVEADAAVPRGAAWVESGHFETATLRGTGAMLSIARATP